MALNPELLAFLGLEPQVRSHTESGDAPHNEMFCRCGGVAHFPPGRHNREAVDEQQGNGITPTVSQWESGLTSLKVSSLNSIIFRDAATAPLSRKLLSLFPGLGYAAGYKISQRIYKFGGQPWFNDLIKKNYKDNFTNTFGERNGKLMMQATAGRCV